MALTKIDSAMSGTNVTTKTTTYAVVDSDDLVPVDGTSGGFTVTLPTAVGRKGKRYTIKRTDQTLANALTIATTSSQTIDGATTRKLSTQYEHVVVQSDGSNWYIVGRYIDQSWTSFASVAAGTLITGTSSNPTYGTTSVNMARWRRSGSNVEIEWQYAQTSNGTLGSGVYLFNLPTGMTIDSSHTVNTNISSGSSSISAPNVVGVFNANYEAGAGKSIGIGEVIPYSTTQLKVYVGFVTEATACDADFWGVFYGFNISPLSFSLRAKFKISGWEG